MTTLALFRRPDRTPTQRLGSVTGYAMWAVAGILACYVTAQSVTPLPFWPAYLLGAVAAVLAGTSVGCWLATRDRRYPS
ncbi:MAG TPA: hypothetical protein VFY44_03310 [Thermoleophilaceae bacterium]|nr:hypothetical protein [Thermoleophilaceae bacterium]